MVKDPCLSNTCDVTRLMMPCVPYTAGSEINHYNYITLCPFEAQCDNLQKKIILSPSSSLSCFAFIRSSWSVYSLSRLSVKPALKKALSGHASTAATYCNTALAYSPVFRQESTLSLTLYKENSTVSEVSVQVCCIWYQWGTALAEILTQL